MSRDILRQSPWHKCWMVWLGGMIYTHGPQTHSLVTSFSLSEVSASLNLCLSATKCFSLPLPVSSHSPSVSRDRIIVCILRISMAHTSPALSSCTVVILALTVHSLTFCVSQESGCKLRVPTPSFAFKYILMGLFVWKSCRLDSCLLFYIISGGATSNENAATEAAGVAGCAHSICCTLTHAGTILW